MEHLPRRLGLFLGEFLRTSRGFVGYFGVFMEDLSRKLGYLPRSFRAFTTVAVLNFSLNSINARGIDFLGRRKEDEEKRERRLKRGKRL